VFASVQGMISSLSVVAMSESQVSASLWAEGISTALFTTFFALLVSFPSYFIVAIGLLVRAILWRGEKSP
jgi:biopolymer transport protein ExbB/TolQ